MQKIKLAAKAFILKDGNILLIKRSINHHDEEKGWDIPGGSLEKDESFEEALHREVFEETALNIKIIDILRAWDFKQEKGTTYGVTFLTQYISGDVKLSDEHSSFKWVGVELCQDLEIEQWIKDEAKIALTRIRNL